VSAVSAGRGADHAERSVPVEHGSSSISGGGVVIGRCAHVVGEWQQRRAGLRGGRPPALHVHQMGQEPAGVRGAAVRRPGAADRGRVERAVRARRRAVPAAARRRVARRARRHAAAAAAAVVVAVTDRVSVVVHWWWWPPVRRQLVRSVIIVDFPSHLQ